MTSKIENQEASAKSQERNGKQVAGSRIHQAESKAA
jgi:hypothetical protein